MNDRQRSITAAFGIILGAFALQNNWLSRLGAWASRPPGQSGAGTPAGAVSLNSWQAAVVLYAILMLIGETDNAGEFAVLVAWGAALGKVLNVAGKVSLSSTEQALGAAGQQKAQPVGPQYVGPAPVTQPVSTPGAGSTSQPGVLV